MKSINIKPTNKNIKVPFENGSGHVPEKGIKVKQNSYWLRRVKDGDLEIVEPKTNKTK